MNARFLFLTLLLLGLIGLRDKLCAQESPQPPPEEVLAITPVQLFESLARETKPLWRQQYRTKIERIVTNREKASLALGAVMTDLSLAMMARDGQQIRNLVQDEEALEKLLGVADKMRNFRQRYLTTADANEWPTLGRLRCWQICTSVVISKKLPVHELAIGSPQLLGEISAVAGKIAEPDSNRQLRFLSRKLTALVKLWQPHDPAQPPPDRLLPTQEILDELIGQLVQDEPKPPAPASPQAR